MFFSLISLIIVALLLVIAQPAPKATDVMPAINAVSLADEMLNRMIEQDVFVSLNSISRYMNDSSHGVLPAEGEYSADDFLAAGFVKDAATLDSMMLELINGSGRLPEQLIRYAGAVNLSMQQQAVMTALRIPMLRWEIIPESIHIWQDSGSGYRAVNVEATIATYIDMKTANWTRNITVAYNMSIEGVLDPFALVKLPAGSAKLNATVAFVRPFSVTDADTVKGLRSLIHNKSYFFEAQAPSLIQRYLGSTAASACCGMESFISLGDNAPEATPLKRKSMIDWCYFSDRCEGLNTEPYLYTLDGLADMDITTDAEGAPFYALAVDDRVLDKFSMKTLYGVPGNECRCPCGSPPAEGEPEEWVGPGCVGTPDDNVCAYLCG
jgi:hypothetical protein